MKGYILGNYSFCLEVEMFKCMVKTLDVSIKQILYGM